MSHAVRLCRWWAWSSGRSHGTRFRTFHSNSPGTTAKGRSAKSPVGVVYEPDELVTRVCAGLRIEELAPINA